MKVTTSDLLAILRRFNEAGDEHVPRHIDQVAQSHPSPINQLVRFRFNRHHYYALFDETAEDRQGYIIHQIETAKSQIEGQLLENPTTNLTTFGLPFKGKDVYLFIEKSSKKRLDILLSERHPETSRSTWQKHIKAGHVAVNGVTVTAPKTEVSETDRIELTIPVATDFSKRELPILYLDDNVIVVDKPVGILTHSKGALNDEFTVADFFRRYTTVGLDTSRPGVVHRLDRDTSGVIIGARTPEAFEMLKHQFAERKAKKEYIAIVESAPKQAVATIDIPIGRNPSAPSTFRADAGGKSAQTSYETLASSSTTSLLSLSPRTGRTHQLRVHLAHIGCPIVGDRVYGRAADRLYLHAHRLEITIPGEAGGVRKTFVAPLPNDFDEKFPGVVGEPSR